MNNGTTPRQTPGAAPVAAGTPSAQTPAVAAGPTSAGKPPAAAAAPGGLSYDISSFDPLQAQALQLTASAGLTSLLGGGQQAQAAQQQAQAAAAAAAAAAQSHIPGYHGQPGLTGLQPIAPAVGTATPATTNPSAAVAATTPHPLSALLTPAALATAAAAGQQQRPPTVAAPGATAPPTAAAVGATHHPSLLYGTTAATAAAAAAPQPTPNAAATIALLMQQLQQAGVANNPFLLQQLAGPIAQATLAQQQLQQQQQQQQQRQTMAPTTAASSILPGMVGNPAASAIPSVVVNGKHPLIAPTDTTSTDVSKRPRMMTNGALVPPVAAAAPTPGLAAPVGVASSSAASGVLSNAGIGGADDPGPPKEASQADLNKMTPAERRRYERNLREQQRSYRISQQIKELRDVLAESNVPFKPNKYSILLSVVDYIKQLQSRAIMLDSEHTKLISTIRQTNDMVSSGTAPGDGGNSIGGGGGGGTDGSETYNAASTSESEGDVLFVKGLDYRSIFEQCPAALGIAALDGRILECNTEFQSLLGFPRDELLKQSLFNLVQNHQDIFRAMAQMLKNAEEPVISQMDGATSGSSSSGGETTNNGKTGGDDNPNMDDPASGGVVGGESGNTNSTIPPISQNRFWTGPVTSKGNVKLLMNITLTLGDNGTPKFFSCAVTNTT